MHQVVHEKISKKNQIKTNFFKLKIFNQSMNVSLRLIIRKIHQNLTVKRSYNNQELKAVIDNMRMKMQMYKVDILINNKHLINLIPKLLRYHPVIIKNEKSTYFIFHSRFFTFFIIQ
jgi:hypothetical protein